MHFSGKSAKFPEDILPVQIQSLSLYSSVHLPILVLLTASSFAFCPTNPRGDFFRFLSASFPRLSAFGLSPPDGYSGGLKIENLRSRSSNRTFRKSSAWLPRGPCYCALRTELPSASPYYGVCLHPEGLPHPFRVPSAPRPPPKFVQFHVVAVSTRECVPVRDAERRGGERVCESERRQTNRTGKRGRRRLPPRPENFYYFTFDFPGAKFSIFCEIL